MTPEQSREYKLEITDRGNRFYDRLIFKDEELQTKQDWLYKTILTAVKLDGSIEDLLTERIIKINGPKITRKTLIDTGWLIDKGYIEIIK